ncbi:hypothetical protein L227DRAFT_515345 [Lentinus tigrinus ALCF2SS1-6]|uniref:Prolyl 4-hydroxylase alpha subunit Fe(2+) 2OG dioxygenase domain-containing protein n=1 Tax=Lentinus tigrinus ALCF2SS1-6 TaxID=1328759 RepID=A0A5C2RNR9_9APHY|nr:hypothetical protein L227DRAFT_515345 [Lentinus tigrinus ALCF2SS1-6]
MTLNPCPQGYDHVLDEAERAYQVAHEQYHFKPCQWSHRRGPFPCVSCGGSYGGGQQRVGNLKHSAHNRAVLEDCLLNNWAIRNLAGLVNRTFRNVAPDMYREYGDILTKVCENDPRVRKNFSNSVFAAATFNFGPQTCTKPHKDHLNVPTGWCAVVALGDFDADEGGHLIVWDLNLMIRFPRGTIIFLPSALFLHSNTTVPKGQCRYSFTQYTAGGLARWVECGFMSQKEFLRRGHAFSRTAQRRWEEGLARLPKWSNWHTQ